MKIFWTASRRLIVESLLILAVASFGLDFASAWWMPHVTGPGRGALFFLMLLLLAGPALFINARAAAYKAMKWLSSSTLANIRLAVAGTLATQVLMLSLTVAAVQMQQHQVTAHALDRLLQAAEQMDAEIRRRFALPLEELKGVRGMYAAGIQVNRAQFRAYVASRDLPREFPGGRGLGFVQRVMRKEVAAFTASQRKDGAPDFAVKSRGQAPDLYVIQYIEPLAPNLSALGLDLGQEHVRRDGVERAIATGEPTLTGEIALVQDGNLEPAFLYFLPVFRSDQPITSPSERLAALSGLLYTPMVASDMLDGVEKVSGEAVGLSFFAGDAHANPKALYESRPYGRDKGAVLDGVIAPPLFVQKRTLDLGGQRFTLQTTSTPAFEAAMAWSSVMMIGVAGLFVSFLAAVTVWLLMAGRLRALLRAQDMTAELDRLAKVVRHTSNSVFIADVEQKITWVNEGFTRITGYTLDEARGRTPGELLGNKKSDPATVRMLLGAAAKGEACRVEILNRTKDGRDYWVDTEVQPMRDESGRLTGFMEISTDVTERRRAEGEVRKAENLLRESIETLDEAFVLFDPADKLVLCNQRYKDLYALSADVIVPGNTFEHIVRVGAERGQYQDAIGRVDAWVAERVAMHRQDRCQVVHALEDGRVLRAIERRMPDGHTVGFRIDITDLVNANRAAEAALVAKSRFLANMSHEIRTPMNAILGLVKVIQNTSLSTEQRDYLGMIDGAGRSLLGVINDVLDFSKAEAGKMVLDPRPFSLDSLLCNLSVILATNLESKNIDMLFDLDPEIPDVLIGDDLRLSQVLINLCGNAVKFTAQGTVVLHVGVMERTSKHILLKFAVQDSGIGIAPENRDRIFNGFSQAEASTTRRFGGTGLGLAISSRLVALMGGQLQVESEEGAGSTFYFQIQCGCADGPDVAAGTPSDGTSLDVVARYRRDGLKVLFVDDKQLTRSALTQLARILRWNSECATDVQEAAAMVQQATAGGCPYQAIFIDWQLPGMNGWRALQFIQKMPHVGAATPLILTGTSAQRASLVQVVNERQLPMPKFIVKPLTVSMLAGAIEASLQGLATLSIPSLQPSANNGEQKTAPATTDEKVPRLKGVRLLVVEDNRINQMVAERLLSQEGADVTLAGNGQVGVDAVANAATAFDAILMDLQMPVMDGFAATRVIRSDPGNAGLPIIAMTANALPADREACLEAGMNDHVGKPFDLDQLVALLRRHIR